MLRSDICISGRRLEFALAIGDTASLAQAIVHAENVIERNSYGSLRASLVHARARLHELRGEYVEALQGYEEEATLNPVDISVNYQLGRVHRLLGDTETAERLLLDALDVVPASPEAHYELARIYIMVGRYDDAIEELESLLSAPSRYSAA